MRLMVLTIAAIAGIVIGWLAGLVYTFETGIVFGLSSAVLLLPFLFWFLPKS